MKKLILKNYHFVADATADPLTNIEPIQDWLVKALLHGKDSRNRARFITLISSRLKELDVEKMRLAELHADKKGGKTIYLVKDKDGKEKETTDKPQGGSFGYKLSKNQAKFSEDYLAYLNEDYVIDVSPATSEMIYGVRDLILNTKQEMSGRMAMRHDEICSAFEDIK